MISTQERLTIKLPFMSSAANCETKSQWGIIYVIGLFPNVYVLPYRAKRMYMVIIK